MKILFVCSGNNGLSPITRNQGDSLVAVGNIVSYFLIEGNGVRGYFTNISKLRLFLKKNTFDIIHAHYSLTAFVASIAGANPLVVSLMGSDVKQGWAYKMLIKVAAWVFRWKQIIVKSEDMQKSLGMKGTLVIPNGVNTERFKPMDKAESQKRLGWDSSMTHILFPSNPKRPEKNYELLRASVEQLGRNDIEVHFFVNVPNEETPYWYNAADVVAMSSLWEGSPNAIKEAMACNCVIVSTDVGDVKWLLGDSKGAYISDLKLENYSDSLNKAIHYCKEKDGLNLCSRVDTLGISSRVIAEKLINIYRNETTIRTK